MSTAPLADALPPYGTIAFDFDSTLSAIEGIDELAGARRDEVAELTRRAMDGEVPMEEVYGRRLALLEPDAEAVRALADRYRAAALPHGAELVRALLALEKRVCIVSGGLLQGLWPLAESWGFAADDVFAVEVYHDREGRYVGFDELSPLARSGGKLEVARELSRAEHRGGVALVGDGVTDLEAAPAVRRFVAFGGVERRPAVFERAVVSCAEPDLAKLLPLLCAPDEIERLAGDPVHAELLGAADVEP